MPKLRLSALKWLELKPCLPADVLFNTRSPPRLAFSCQTSFWIQLQRNETNDFIFIYFEPLQFGKMIHFIHFLFQIINEDQTDYFVATNDGQRNKSVWLDERNKEVTEKSHNKELRMGKVLLEEAQEWEVRIEKFKWEKSQTLENFIKIFIEKLVREKLQ